MDNVFNFNVNECYEERLQRIEKTLAIILDILTRRAVTLKITLGKPVPQPSKEK
jgi:hypothetical protein